MAKKFSCPEPGCTETRDTPQGIGAHRRHDHGGAKKKRPATPPADPNLVRVVKLEANGLTAKGALAKIEERLAPLRVEVAELEAARKVLLTLSAS
jgi:hypothetical protein